MLKIRLRRMGKRKQPTFRMVVAESTAPRDGKFVEIIGSYNPRTEPETVQMKKDRVLHWLQVGAQPTESVARILKTHGVMDLFARLRAGETLEAVLTEPVVEETAEDEVAEVVEAVEEAAETTEVEEEVEVEADESADESVETTETAEEVEEVTPEAEEE